MGRVWENRYMDSMLGDNGEEGAIRRRKDLLDEAINRHGQNLRIVSRKRHFPLKLFSDHSTSTYPVRRELSAMRLLLGLPGGVLLLSGLLLPLVFQSREVGPADFIVHHDKDFIASLRERSCRSGGTASLGSFLEALRRAFD